MTNAVNKIKKIVLGLFIVVSMMSVNVSDVDAESSNNNVSLDKSATRVSDRLNEWDVNLHLEVAPTVAAQDIILVMDRSGSMEGNRLTSAKNAAKKFVDALLVEPELHDNRIALISYGSTVTQDLGFSTDASGLKSKINALTADGGTFSQGAIKSARDLMSSKRASATPIIVFLSDGAPTFGYTLSSTGVNKYTAPDKSPFSTSVEIRSFYQDLSSGHGSSTSYTGVFSQLDDFSEENYLAGDFDYNLSTAGGEGLDAYHLLKEHKSKEFWLLNLFKTVVSEAQFAKNAGSTIYSIALDLGHDQNATDSLKKISSGDDYFMSGAAGDLEEQFNEIAQDLR